MEHVVVLGAGFGGLELAKRISEDLSDDLRVTLIDQADAFVIGFSKFDVLFGRKTKAEVSMYYRDLAMPGVEFRQERVSAIDPATRVVTTDRGTHEADHLVVALGADYAPEATPGFVEGGYEFYSVAGAERLRDVLPTIDRGRIVIGILGAPFKCPPAPFEGALLIHDQLVERGVREHVEIELISPLPSPIPVSEETSAAIVTALDERGIGHAFGRKVTAIDPSAGVAHVAEHEDEPYDLFIGIPVHRAPEVVEASGLTEGGNDGWVRVDRANLRTPFEGVYAIGDVADAPVPRAGTFAEGAARTVADDLGARLRGRAFERPFEGKGTCYIEIGAGRVAKVEVDFLSGPTPTAPFKAPRPEYVEEKRAFAADRRRRWFSG